MSKDQKPTQQERVVELHAQGYGVDAISCKLNLAIKAVRQHLFEAGVHLRARPPSPEYISIKEAAEQTCQPYGSLLWGVGSGNLRYIICGNQKFTTLKWARVFRDNGSYRMQAKAIQDRLFASRAKPGK